MKKITKISAVAMMAAAISVSASAKEAGAAATEEKSVGWTPIAIGLATPVQMPWSFNWDVFGRDVNLAYADANRVAGVEVALGGCVSRTYLAGLQVSAICNYNDGDLYGMQAAICDINDDVYGFQASAFAMGKHVYGLQANLLGAIATEEFWGLRVSGLASLNNGKTAGAEISGLVNLSRTVEGCQIALGYNQTEVLHGCQIALVNYAQSSTTSAFQIGLVNIIRDNVVPVLPLVNGCFFDGTDR